MPSGIPKEHRALNPTTISRTVWVQHRWRQESRRPSTHKEPHSVQPDELFRWFGKRWKCWEAQTALPRAYYRTRIEPFRRARRGQGRNPPFQSSPASRRVLGACGRQEFRIGRRSPMDAAVPWRSNLCARGLGYGLSNRSPITPPSPRGPSRKEAHGHASVESLGKS